MKQRIYVDTSFFGGCFDREFRDISVALLKEFKGGKKICVISDLTLTELKPAPVFVRALPNVIPGRFKRIIQLSAEARILAKKYITEKAITKKNLIDGLHIALATVSYVDVLVSWNFQHIVNLERIHIFNGINLKNGYHLLEIRSPREVLHER